MKKYLRFAKVKRGSDESSKLLIRNYELLTQKTTTFAVAVCFHQQLIEK